MNGSFLKGIGRAIRKKFSKNGLLTIFRHTWHLLAVFLVILAVVFTFFRALTPWVKQYRSQIQQQLSVWVGQDVAIQDIGTSWYWFTPVLKLKQVVIGEGQEHALHFNQVMVGINLFSSLLRGHIQPGVLFVDNVHLKIHQQDDIWRIDGLNLPSDAQANLSSPSRIAPFVELLLAQDKVIVKHVSAELSLQDGTHISLQNLHFKSDHHSQNYRLYSKVSIGGKPDIQMTMVANMTLDGHDWNQLSGQAYLSLSRTDLTAMQKIFPQAPIQIKQGTGSLDAWLDFVHGRLALAQATVKMNDVVMQEPSRTKPRKISNATANLAWQRLSQGWRLISDQCVIHLDGIDWPENAFMIEYRKETEDYHAYVKTIPLKQLVQTELPWPKLAQPILQLKPNGILTDTEISWQKSEIRDFLTKFSQLSWQRTGSIPGISALSGAVYWQPSEGRLELNGEHSVISMQKPLAPVTLDTLNASLDWKYLSQGWRVSLDRLIISHPNLILSAVGAMDDPWGPAANLRLQMDFSAKEGQVWLPYIPSKGLKPKLDAWLKHDIPRIARASGRMRIVGPVADFPFDNQNGEFSIQSHVNGVDLLIDSNWPVNADIDADIRVTGRHFVADVHQANLNDVMVNQVSISIPEIGLGKEVLLLHGKVEAPGEKIKSYVFASPLQKRFARWKALTVGETLGLDLNLEAPLYPESEHVYAKGSLDFNQNPVSVEFVDNPAEFVGVNGRLDFNEYGLTSGGLDGTLNNYPFTVRVQPLLGPKAGTELRVDGEADISYLRHLIHHPVFSVMQGRFIVNGLWTVYPDSPEADKLYLNSSLVGMAVRLPPPFGKSLASIAPMSIKIDFSPQHRMDFDVNYAQKLTGIFTMQQTPQQNWVAAGDLHLGGGPTSKTNTSGLRISGSLPDVNVDAWRAVWNKWPKVESSASLLASLKEVNLSIEKVTLPTVIYPSVKFNAHKISPQEWSFNLHQKDISGEFGYNWTENSLYAHIAHFNIATLPSSPSASASSKWKPKMEDIPNLDVTVDAVNYKGLEMGKISFNSSTKPGHWTLNTGRIETPEYAVGFKGDWVEQNEKNASSIEAELHLSRLANALTRWNVTPVVDAHYGSMSFSGKWPSAFYDGSLKKLSGKMSLILRDGHISHLDRDTEKKLGLGKLLSILSLQTIPRRLKLDFSDLSHKGYTFDLFKGTFQIRSGIMSTDDSYIDGPVAFGRMSGDLDLVNQLYDLDLRIFPYVTASLPIVASIVGTPVAGVAVWAVSSLANKGMQKISGYTYKISGPWMSPVVQQISIDKSVH